MSEQVAARQSKVLFTAHTWRPFLRNNAIRTRTGPKLTRLDLVMKTQL